MEQTPATATALGQVGGPALLLGAAGIVTKAATGYLTARRAGIGRAGRIRAGAILPGASSTSSSPGWPSPPEPTPASAR